MSREGMDTRSRIHRFYASSRSEMIIHVDDHLKKNKDAVKPVYIFFNIDLPVYRFPLTRTRKAFACFVKIKMSTEIYTYPTSQRTIYKCAL